MEPSGIPASPAPPASRFSSTDNTYLVQASDPASTGTGWKYTLKQYATSDCTGGATKSASKTFYVAQATVYADPALTTPKTAFAAGTTAYVTVTGVTPSLTGWSTTWLLPSGATACANTAGTDRADSSSSSNLPPKWTNSDLQYRPNTTATGSAWNREANYEVRPCPSFGTSNEGTWKLRLDGNPTNFVVLPVFTVDATPPPAPTITSAPADPSNAASASFGFSDTEAGVGFRCQLDGGGFGACSSPGDLRPPRRPLAYLRREGGGRRRERKRCNHSRLEGRHDPAVRLPDDAGGRKLDRGCDAELQRQRRRRQRRFIHRERARLQRRERDGNTRANA